MSTAYLDLGAYLDATAMGDTTDKANDGYRIGNDVAYVWGPAPRDGFVNVQLCPVGDAEWDTYILILDIYGGVLAKNDNVTTHGCIGSAISE